MIYGSLFSGIGGIDLGLDRAGMSCAWQVEIDPYCRKVLEKHWPGVDRFNDIKKCGAHNLKQVDLIAGGFPCQDISLAGKGAGIEGEKSGLWSEYKRIICELRPRIVVVENVSALLVRGLERVLGDLAESGYNAEWDCIPAAAVGAPHRRDRVFIVACSRSQQHQGRRQTKRREASEVVSVANTQHGRISQRRRAKDLGTILPDKRGIRSHVTQGGEQETGGPLADADSMRMEGAGAEQQTAGTCGEGEGNTPGGAGGSNPRRKLLEGRESPWATYRSLLRSNAEWWATEPDVGRVANGVPRRVDRLKGLGNAVVPQVAEFIGRMIMDYNKESKNESE